MLSYALPQTTGSVNNKGDSYYTMLHCVAIIRGQWPSIAPVFTQSSWGSQRLIDFGVIKKVKQKIVTIIQFKYQSRF
jgi:hypothetical protein